MRLFMLIAAFGMPTSLLPAQEDASKSISVAQEERDWIAYLVLNKTAVIDRRDTSPIPPIRYRDANLAATDVWAISASAAVWANHRNPGNPVHHDTIRDMLHGRLSVAGFSASHGTAHWLMGHNLANVTIPPMRTIGIIQLTLISASTGTATMIYNGSQRPAVGPWHPLQAIAVPPLSSPVTGRISATEAADACRRAASSAALAIGPSWTWDAWSVPMVWLEYRSGTRNEDAWKDERTIVAWRTPDGLTRAMWWIASDGTCAAPLFDHRTIQSLPSFALPKDFRVPSPPASLSATSAVHYLHHLDQ